MSDFDTSLENYSKEDLMNIFDVEPHNTLEEVKKKSGDYLDALENEHPDIIEFVKNAQQKLLETHNLSIDEGNKNPILKQHHQKILCLDSRFRQNNTTQDNQNIDDPKTPTELIATNIETSDFTINLSETMKNVIELTFDRIYIPFSWYNVYEPKNTFQITVGAADSKPITISPGNYVLNEDVTDNHNIIKAINDALVAEGLNIVFSFNSLTGKVTITNNTASPVEIDFINTGNLVCRQKLKINNNLGTILGFKKIKYTIPNTGTIISEGFPNMIRTKYIIVEINDFNKNYIANKFVHGRNRDDVASLPNYFKGLENVSPTTAVTSVNYACVDNNEKNSGIVANNPNKVPLINKVFPRQMTNNQIYSLNQIIKSRANNNNLKQEFESAPNTFAVISLASLSTIPFGSLIIYDDDSPDLNMRSYFGPVDLERMNVRVLDENGEILDLNGADWSMTISVKHLYQY
jgi:hypothetical protein